MPEQFECLINRHFGRFLNENRLVALLSGETAGFLLVKNPNGVQIFQPEFGNNSEILFNLQKEYNF
jgi:hypothetical protein